MLIVIALLHEHIQRSEWDETIREVVPCSTSGQASDIPSPFCSRRHRVRNRGIAFGDVWYYGYDGISIDFTPGEEARLWGWFAATLLLMICAVLGLGRKRITGLGKDGNYCG